MPMNYSKKILKETTKIMPNKNRKRAETMSAGILEPIF